MLLVREPEWIPKVVPLRLLERKSIPVRRRAGRPNMAVIINVPTATAAAKHRCSTGGSRRKGRRRSCRRMWLKPTGPKRNPLLLDLVIEEWSTGKRKRHGDGHLLDEF